MKNPIAPQNRKFVKVTGPGWAKNKKEWNNATKKTLKRLARRYEMSPSGLAVQIVEFVPGTHTARAKAGRPPKRKG